MTINRVQVLASQADIEAWNAFGVSLKAKTNKNGVSLRSGGGEYVSIYFKLGSIATGDGSEILLSFVTTTDAMGKCINPITPDQRTAISSLAKKIGMTASFSYSGKVSLGYISSISKPNYSKCIKAIFKLMCMGDNKASPDQLLIQSRTALIMEALKNTPEGKFVRQTDAPKWENNGCHFSMRDWGTWVNPEDAEDEEDYDWQVLSDASRKKLDGYMAKIAAKFPRMKADYSTDEKNWLTIYVTKK